MYIWILLATIMVALSFMNISPRPDKDNAVNEVRAASVINRFRAEHTAMLRTIECEAILGIDTKKDPTDGSGGWTSNSENSAVEITKDPNGDYDLGYIKYSESLPVGYDLTNTAVNVKHYVFCVNGNLEKEGIGYANCLHTGRRYFVSVMPVPNKWRAKTTNENGNIMPLPLFSNFMTDEGFSGMSYGWTECNGNAMPECLLHGRSAALRTSEMDAAGVYQRKYIVLPKNSIVWQVGGIKDVCNKKDTPCLMVYTRIIGHDKGGYCYKHYHDWLGDL
ncbi:MAG: hypothetical protein J6Y91_04365 [Alphaproteobacteria bacterium]|nr:hypothetical protein [Alphaproteobacteria bacterium]